jgi:mannose-1-phosphate guanylyltransferase / phosphomannomutase
MAGGEGTRLRPLTCNRPKPMIPVINKPVLEHIVNLLRKKGITDITISCFYLPENIQNYFGDGSEWNVNISYSVEEAPMGTAGGVRKAVGQARGTILVLSGDGVVDFDIDKVREFHREKKSALTIVLTHVSEPTEYGIVITRPDGRIDKFLEKPAWSEVFSDTVNTGMYLIEPDIINEHIPEGTRFDFSMDLFPLLQHLDVPMYGCVAEGYWCDVGNLGAYRDVHLAILEGRVGIDFPGKKIGGDIWVGRNVEIAPNVKLRGPIILGNFVRIKRGAEVSEYTVIGDNCVIEENATVRRSILLHNTLVGPKCHLRGALIGKRCVLGEGVAIYEGAVVSDDCQIGSAVQIPSGIRVWPEKIIEQGTTLTADLIWGQTEKKTLFGGEGIIGSFNIRITPEFAAKLGSALGAFLGGATTAVVSRDASLASRIIKRAVSAGLLSMGVEVYDLDIESVPINRYSTRFLNADLGVYVHIAPMTGLQFVQIKLFNRFGFQLSVQDEKKIENIFYRGDYPRKNAFEVGRLIYPIHHIESYIANAENYVDKAVLVRSRINVIVDFFNGASAMVFPDLLARFGCTLTALRAQIKEYVSENELKKDTRNAIETVVSMTRANGEIGAILDPHGENITIVDESGAILSGDDAAALICLLHLKYRNVRDIQIPVTSSAVIERIAAQYGGRVRRTSTKLREPEGSEDIFLPKHGERLPYLEMEFDPMIGFLLVLELVAREQNTLAGLRAGIPLGGMRSTSIQCTSEEKAAIMKTLSATEPGNGTSIELTDGVRVVRARAWILIMPDSTNPLIHLYAEGDSIEEREAIINEFTGIISHHTRA